MGAPPPDQQSLRSPRLSIDSPVASSSTMNSPYAVQHERLILELLPFKDSASFHSWLQSDQVRGSFQEFTRDLLQHARPNQQGGVQHFPDPDKETTAKAARDAIDGKVPRFLLYHPDKDGWSVQDHHVRFIVTVAQDNALTKTWSLKKEGTTQIAKAVYEVLCYLKASLVVPDPNPPGYSKLLD